MYKKLAVALAVAFVPAVVSADVTFSIGLDVEDAEVTTLTYECGDADPFPVHYLNSDSNVLALVPVDGDHRVFVNVVSGSGARYVAGQYEWWTQGENATLTNVIEDTRLRECVISSR